MLNSRYFYEERGVTKKYVYCSRCGGGPFKQTETDKFVQHGDIVLCKAECSVLLQLKKDSFSPKADPLPE